MSRVVQIAWTLPALYLILFAARVALSDLTRHRTRPGPSWSSDDHT